MDNIGGYARNMGMGKRIQERLHELGWGQTELLGRVPELSKSSLSALISRDSGRSQWSEKIADAIGVHHKWLQSGSGPRGLAAAAEVSNWNSRGSVPLISWRAVSVMDDQDAYAQAIEGAQWIPTHETPPRAGWFAVTIDSDAMTAPAGASPSFPRGTVMIVAPDVTPAPGDFVVARDPQTGLPTCKRLAADSGRLLLVPLNPAYPSVPIESTACVIGSCMEWHTGGVLKR